MVETTVFPPRWYKVALAMDFYTLDDCQNCPERIVCHCLQITETVLLDGIATHELKSIKDIRCRLGAGDGCTACHKLLKKYLEEHTQSASSLPICSVK